MLGHRNFRNLRWGMRLAAVRADPSLFGLETLAISEAGKRLNFKCRRAADHFLPGQRSLPWQDALGGGPTCREAASSLSFPAVPGELWILLAEVAATCGECGGPSTVLL